MSQAQAIPRAEPIPVDALEELFVRPRRDLGADELWERSLARSYERRRRLAEGSPRGVRVQPISGSYWGRSYIGTRRAD